MTKFTHLRAAFLLALFTILAPSQGHADDQCKDVLANAVFNTLKVKKDNCYSIALLSTLDENTESDKTALVQIAASDRLTLAWWTG